MIPTSFRRPGPRESSSAVQDPGAIAADGTAAAQWQRTLWAMVGVLADLTGSYRIPFYCTSATILLSMGLVWVAVQERFVAPPKARGRGSILSSLIAVATTPALLALFFVLLMAQFGVRTVQPVVTLFVQEMVGARPDLATLSGIAFSVTLANVVSAPFLGNRSDVIGYRRVLLIYLLGATLTILPQAFTENYWTFTAERLGLAAFCRPPMRLSGGSSPEPNAARSTASPRRRCFSATRWGH
jgi:predicted MFS family arabinose efflux permease